ncbi:MAG: hypothetical protein ACI4U3_05790 [Traorella sp.]
MTKKNKIFLLLLVTINLGYILFLLFSYIGANKTTTLPTITFDNELVEISVKDDIDVLLQGVYAYDNEDGDISDQVFIYNISSFNENHERTVTYGVFDSENQMVMANRKFIYSDYASPKFSSKKPLTTMMSSLLSQETTNIQATSSVDGDISSKISMTQNESESKIYYNYSVTDSTGTSATLEVSEEISLKGLMMNVTIELSDYIIYVEKGTTINFKDYILDVQTSIGSQSNLIRAVEVETNYNAWQSGTYEALFTLNRTNGDYGAVKMYIIVEDENGK